MSKERTYGLGWAGSGNGRRAYHLTRHDRETMYLCQIEKVSGRVRRLEYHGRKTLEEWKEERTGLCKNCLELAEREESGWAPEVDIDEA